MDILKIWKKASCDRVLFSQFVSMDNTKVNKNMVDFSYLLALSTQNNVTLKVLYINCVQI